MKILKQLAKGYTLKDLTELPEGHKIAVTFSKDTLLDYAYNAVYKEDEGIDGVDFDYSTVPLEFVEGFTLKDSCEIFAEENKLIVLEKVNDSLTGISAVVKPFTGVYEEYTCDFHLLDTDDETIVTLYEVSI